MKTMSQVKADVSLMRQQMQVLGYAMGEPLIPVVHVAGKRWMYAHSHEVILMREDRPWDEAIYWHELCHSQQVCRGTDAGYRVEGRVDHGQWLESPRELQAMAVQELSGRSDWRQLIKVCQGKPLEQHRLLIKASKEKG